MSNEKTWLECHIHTRETHTHTHTHTHTRTHTHSYTHIHTHIYTRTHTLIHRSGATGAVSTSLKAATPVALPLLIKKQADGSRTITVRRKALTRGGGLVVFE